MSLRFFNIWSENTDKLHTEHCENYKPDHKKENIMDGITDRILLDRDLQK